MKLRAALVHLGGWGGTIERVTTTMATDVYAETTRMDLHELVRVLLENLGVAAVQGMTGTKDRSVPARWAREDGPTPQTVTQQRLRLGFQVWRTVELAEGRDVALAFMLGANPRLGDDMPLNAVYELNRHDVLGAARAFVEDVHSA